MRAIVRLPQPGDVRSIERLEQVCFTDPWPGHFFASEILAPGRFNRVLVDPAGHLLAFIFSVWQYLDLHVLKIATAPESRRMGLARRLMAMAETHAIEMGGESVTLEVRESNVEALAMYASIGYLEMGRRPAYYADGEDALVMTRRLPP